MNPTRLHHRLVAVALSAMGIGLAACSPTPAASGSTAPSAASSGPAAAAALAAPGAGSINDFPASVHSCGREFTYRRAPSRVVLGNYRSLATLQALGVDGSVYGYLLGPDDRGQIPATLPAGLVMVSPETIPAREPVITARPDLFLSFNEAQLLGQGTLSYDDLAAMGANAYVLGAYCAQSPIHGGIDSVYSDITNLGTIFGVQESAARLDEQLRGRVATAKASLDGATATVAFLKVVGGKVYAIGGYPASAVLDALGLTNEFADLPTTFAELTPEQALAMRLDIVFVNYLGDEQSAIADLATVLPGLPAVTAGRVYGADENLAQGGGVGVIDLLDAVAADVRDAGAPAVPATTSG